MAPELESKEKFSYNLYGMHHKCSYHGDRHLAKLDGLDYCLECDSMDEEKKGVARR